MPTFDSSGLPTTRSAAEIELALIDALADKFGAGVRSPNNSIHKFAEALASTPISELEQELLDIFTAADPFTATGTPLDSALWPLFERISAELAVGTVNVNYNQIPTTPNPLFDAADITFIDGDGEEFNLSASVAPPTAFFDSNTTGTASESIGGVNTKIAQKFVTTAERFMQLAQFTATHVSGTPLANVRIETDAAGEPSGTLAATSLEVTGLTVNNGTATDVVFTSGAIVDDGTYWLVFEITGGEATFDGGVGGDLDQVSFETGGSYGLSALENLNLEIMEGGLFPIEAAAFGPGGNLQPNAISNQQFSNTTASTRWGNIVASANNLEALEGGRNVETDAELRRRARVARSALPGASVNGLQSLLSGQFNSADVIENDTLDWGQGDDLLDNSLLVGTSSETIDATNTKIAHRFTTTDYRSVASVAFNLATESSFDATVSIETDAAGVPSGTLASPKFTKSGVMPGGTGRAIVPFDSGDFLPAGTYWAVVTRDAGAVTFDGDNGSANDDVYYFNGTWNLSALIDDAAFEVYGGIPPKAFRAFVDGGTDNAVAQAIFDAKAAGIYSDGPETGSATVAPTGAISTVRFERPVKIPVAFSMTVLRESTFGGDADVIRDLIVEYVGGTGTNGLSVAGQIGVGAKLVRAEALARLLHGDVRTVGVFDVENFRVGANTTPGALTASNEVNLTPSRGQLFFVNDPENDIDVNFVDV